MKCYKLNTSSTEANKAVDELSSWNYRLINQKGK